MRKIIVKFCIVLGLIPFAVQGQTVQGVNGAALWFQAAPVTESLLNGEYHFADKSGNGLMLHVGTGTTEYTQLRSAINTINFNPAIDISKPAGGLLTSFSHVGLQQATVIGVFAPKNESQASVVYSINGDNPFSLYTDSIKYGGGQASLSYSPNLKGTLGEGMGDANKTLPRIVTYTRTLMPSHSLWDAPETRTFKLFGSFNGYCPEVMVFNRMLSQLERRKVESYLALKYGLTLLGSYYDSSGNLIWDADGNKYHHRVTGIGNNGSLSQTVSATSYDKYCNTADRQNESFYNHNSYGSSTASRLLTIGREPGNAIASGSYLLWGDDDGSSVPPAGNWRVMPRHWQVRSSIVNKTNADSLTLHGLTATGSDGLYKITGSGMDKYVTIGPASSGDKCLEFTCPSSGSFQVGLVCSDTTGICSYGYQFANGQVKRVIDGTAQGSTLSSQASGKSVRIHRRGEWMSLCLDDAFVSGSMICVPAYGLEVVPVILDSLIHFGNADEPDVFNPGNLGGEVTPVYPGDSRFPVMRYTGIIKTITSASLTIADLRVGGFSDTGNRVELGFATLGGNSPFATTPTASYLLVSTTDSFTGNNVTKYPCSEVDAQRSKIIFHNVKFPQGISYFTFANGTPPSSAAKENPPVEEPTSINNDGAKVFGIESVGGSANDFTAWLDLPGGGQATLLVFDAAGRLYGEYEMKGQDRRTASFTLRHSGVYIFKALTPIQEYTRKITVKQL